MKKIGQVFLYDISHIKKNVIAMIVVLGLCVVPSLYAWFNIAASWDPYSNTNGLKVAVANTDEGYEGEILPLQINIGDAGLDVYREKGCSRRCQIGKILCRDRNSEKFQSGYDEPVFGGDDTFRYYILYQ